MNIFIAIFFITSRRFLKASIQQENDYINYNVIYVTTL